ncbi:erythromycin esterase family protein [Emcibacter sp.]|uniref:erythromycin esterase family protein n=1 Tax=Emcibacter sp. TaxID=1979954 RepID=UPI002AA6AD0C|nr:erythromycin esterase family protein [Emcibacter sp.]
MANPVPDQANITALEKHVRPLGGQLQDHDEIVEAAGDKRFVLIGEASHGTKEFYRARAELTERLISEKGFDAVAVEADWPDAFRVNRYVSQQGTDSSAEQALGNFERFPTWMWRNREVEHFVHWLHDYNLRYISSNPDLKRRERPVGFYGLDLYSMNSSIHAVIDYLDGIDPEEARKARMRYGCLYHFMDNPQSYGYAMHRGLADSCEDDIIQQLLNLREKSLNYLRRNGLVAEEEYFGALRNAELVKSAEEYYRSLYRGHPNSWNLRDQHMFDTLNSLSDFISDQLGREARIVVWAHNSHIGNAAATEMGRRGEFNIGQLAREKYGRDALLVGFSTCQGTVMAASDWDMPHKVKTVRTPIAGSYEELFHHVNHKKFLLNLREGNEAVDRLMEARLQRAIGVIYRPETERQSHYFQSCLPEQFDFMIHYDETTAVEPLDTIPHPHKGELDDTYPYGV